MKILSIHIVGHPVFPNHNVIFGEFDVPAISFIVGDNGSGKSWLLDLIYEGLFQTTTVGDDYSIIFRLLLTNQESEILNIEENIIQYRFVRENSQHTTALLNNANEIINTNNLSLERIAKIIYSTPEVLFKDKQVDITKRNNIDNPGILHVKSDKILEEIPQLLVDIKNLDDIEKAEWFETNRENGYQGQFPDIGIRLKRFTDAFNTIYGSSKSFSKIVFNQGSNRLIFTDETDQEITLTQLSTGERQIIYRLGFILKELKSLNGGILLIDEPEISLHPAWQIKLKDFILEIFEEIDVQIIIVTHSPFIFKKLNEDSESCIIIKRLEPDSRRISMTFPGINYNPSIQLISYLAFGIYDELLHIELYTLLHIKTGRKRINRNDGLEAWLRDPANGNQPGQVIFDDGGVNKEETIMTWIRNKIHHSDNLNRPMFNNNHLKQSIDIMITLLR